MPRLLLPDDPLNHRHLSLAARAFARLQPPRRDDDTCRWMHTVRPSRMFGTRQSTPGARRRWSAEVEVSAMGSSEWAFRVIIKKRGREGG